MNETTPAPEQSAATQLAQAIFYLKVAKGNLLKAKSDQYIPVAIKLADLEAIHEILINPE